MKRTMNRREFVRTATAGAATAAVAPHAFGRASDATKPNVLFVLADQWRSSAFSHSTDPHVLTPAFDRLASKGALWTRAYACNPVCSPNRSSIITGRFCHEHGIIHNDLMLRPDNSPCLAEVFGAAGFRTHYIGKWHMDGNAKPGYVPKGWRRRGFDTFEGFNRGHYYPKGAKYFTDDGELLKPDEYSPKYQTDLAIRFMKSCAGRPFFCYLSWGPPHMPYNAPEGFKRLSNLGDKMKWRPNVPAEYRENERSQNMMAEYYNLCESLDAQMNRLMNFLDESGLARNTIVVFTSDHGDMHGSHNLRYKSKPEEESLHVPLIMRWPDGIRQPGRKVDMLCSTIDLMPTMLSMCGLPCPDHVTGRNLSGAVTGKSAPKVESVYCQGNMKKADKQWRCIVTPTHKLAVYGNQEETKLFDLEKDPYEMKNLAGLKAHTALRKLLNDELHAWAKKTGDPFPEAATPAKVMYSDEEATRMRSNG